MDLPARLTARYCSFVAADGHWHRWPYGDCETGFEITFLPLLRERIHLVEVGKVAYDCAAAAKCLGATDSAVAVRVAAERMAVHNRAAVPWVPEAAIDRACFTIFSGSAPVQSQCDDDAECAPGLRCWGCPGFCIAPSARGGPCHRDAVCADADTCQGGTCVALPVNLPVGATCLTPNGPRDDFFGLPHGCANGLQCLPNGDQTSKPWTCQAAGLAAGSVCAGAAACASSTCVAGKCVAAPPVVADGTPCTPTGSAGSDSGKECGGKSCLPAGHGKYVCWGVDQSTLPCGTAGCTEANYCAADGVTCKPLPQAGEACDDSDICQGGTCPPGDGVREGVRIEACDASCGPLACKADGTCAQRLLGEACKADEECNDTMPLNSCIAGHCRRTFVNCAWPAVAP